MIKWSGIFRSIPNPLLLLYLESCSLFYFYSITYVASELSHILHGSTTSAKVLRKLFSSFFLLSIFVSFLSLYVSWSKLNQQKEKRKEKKKEQIVEVKYSDCQRCFGNTANNHNHIWQQALCCLRSIWDEEGTVSPMFCERYCIITFDFRCGECAF